MDVDTAWQQSLFNFNAAVRGYERKFVHARQQIRTLLENSERELHQLSERLDQSTLNENPDQTVSPSEQLLSKTNQLDTLYGAPINIESAVQQQSGKFNEAIERIVSIRLQIYRLATDTRRASGQWNQLLADIEEVEARALSIVVLPSNSLLDDAGSSADQQLTFVINRLEAQAKRCLDEAQRFASTGTTRSKDCASTHVEDSVESKKPVSEVDKVDKQEIPTIARSQTLVDRSTQLLYPLLSDYNLRRQTLCVKRIVGCACSQIIRTDPVHCLDRMNHLLTFLEGGSVKSSGVNASLPSATSSSSGRVALSDLLPDQLGSIYAWQCLYSAAISQAEHQFAYSLDSAITFASLLLGILARHPDKVTEFLARLFIASPALAYFVDSQASSALLNAQKTSESSDSLPRLRGIARLFGALTVALPPPSLRCSRPPHLTPAVLWSTIAAIVNADWIPCFSAEVLHGLLEAGGSVLFKLYGNQMMRLLTTIVSIIKSSPDLSHSIPEISLLSLIESTQKTGSFSSGTNRLESSFWTTVKQS